MPVSLPLSLPLLPLFPVMAPRRGGGALRSASATAYPPPPSPLPGVDQSFGARSIRGDELSDEEMLAPIRFVGRRGLALLTLLTLVVLWGLERFSQFIAGRSQDPCEARVRAVLNPFWTVALAYGVFAIGAAVFLFLWEVRQCSPPPYSRRSGSPVALARERDGGREREP